MSKKRLLYGIIGFMALTFTWAVPTAYGTSCNIHLFAANLPQNPGFSFILAIANYSGGVPETFDVRAYLPDGTERTKQVSLPPHQSTLLFPADIPVNSGELVFISVCWRFGNASTIVQPGSAMLLAVGGSFTAIPPVSYSF